MGSIKADPSTSPEFVPSSYPPFPSDTRPCIELQTLSYHALQAGDVSESARLSSICQDKGFFYLDVSDSDVESLSLTAEAITAMSEDFHKLPLQEKMKYPFLRKPGSILGFKPAGDVKQDAYGKKGDTVEFMNCGKDDIAEIPGRIATELPPIFTEPSTRKTIAQFQKMAHETGLKILSILAVQLGLPADAFSEMHRFDRPSDSHIRMTRSPPRITDTELEISNPGHTDFGSITLLWNWLGGLQLWSESNHGESFDNGLGSDLGPEAVRRGEWLWVKPKPGHIIVNLGDCAVKHTGGLLCAGRHRVVPAPGVQGKYPRYSLIYFVRPADDHVLKRLEGGVIPKVKEGEVEEELTALEWTTKQYRGLKNGTENKELEKDVKKDI